MEVYNVAVKVLNFTSEGWLEAEVNVLLGVQADDEGWDIDDLGLKLLEKDREKQITVAPWPHKDKKLVSLTISTDPSYIWSSDSKTELR